jgi:hypothetical protein
MHQQLSSIGPIHELAEDMAWSHLYRAVRQPAAAAEVVKYLASSPEAMNRHEALYLIAAATLTAKALADERIDRAVAFFRAIFLTAPIRTLQLVQSIVLGIPRVPSIPAVDPRANQPKGRVSRARARVNVLGKHPEIAQAISGFTASSSTSPAAPEATAADQTPASRGSKAA